MDDASSQGNPPLPPKDNLAERLKKEAEMEKVAESRRKLLEQDRAKRAGQTERKATEQEQAREQFLQETTAEKKRGEEREVWRKAQHAERFADEQKRFKARLEKEREAELKRKAAEEERKQHEKMQKLHEQAITGKVRERRTELAHEEERQERAIKDHLDRMLHDIDTEAERNRTHLKREGERVKDRLRKAADQQKIALQQKKASKRELFGIDEALAVHLRDAEAETKHLLDEASRDAAQKRAHTQRDAERRISEAKHRRETGERWLGG